MKEFLTKLILFVLYCNSNPIFCKKFLEDDICGFGNLCKGQEVSNALELLECLQRFRTSDLNTECRNVVLKYTDEFFTNNNIREFLSGSCSPDISDLWKNCDPSRNLIFCVLENRNNFSGKNCQQIVQRIEYAVATNFAFISAYKSFCSDDIRHLKCEDTHSVMENQILWSFESNILDCLQKNIDQIKSTRCYDEVMFLSGIQGEDVQMDTALYLSCSSDRFRICPHLSRKSNSAQLYKCLIDHINDPDISPDCQSQLLKREKLVSKDFRISRGLSRACRSDIKNYRCKRFVSDDRAIRLAQILLCLENVERNGSVKVSPACRIEMLQHRKLLLEDYRLSPELISQCSNDIENYCQGLEVGGKTIHCLMEHTGPKQHFRRISPPCQKALDHVLETADVAEDWRIDPILRNSCYSAVREFCSEMSPGDSRVLSCLMDNIYNPNVKTDCRDELVQIQYFLARNFKLDPPLYRECFSDAKKLCGTDDVTWNNVELDDNKRNLILPCLRRYNYNLTLKCAEQVKRVMRQRAISVQLQPEIEQSCVSELAVYCQQLTGPGEEMRCLQDNFVKLTPICKQSIGNYTEAEAGDIDLNPIVKLHCSKIIKEFCKVEISNGKPEPSDGVMECLIHHKFDQENLEQRKCRAAVEHFQLISVNDYHFTVSFKTACRPYVSRYCPKAHTKYEVVECLSEIIRNDTLKDEKFKISKECRYQLKSQLLQQRELIDLNPKFKLACENDVKKFCSKAKIATNQILECLEESLANLSPKCHRMVFNIEKQDFADSSTDYALTTICKNMIKFYCSKEESNNALWCLKKYKDDAMFDTRCRALVIKRMVEQSVDYRLNPALSRGCGPDVKKWCFDVVKNHATDKEFDGKVVQCLKVKFRQEKLRRECEKQLAVLLKESALDYKLNPLLRSLCEDEIRQLCAMEVEMEEISSDGKVEECLKVAFVDGNIADRACRLEVAGLIEESRADISADPLLQSACLNDVNHRCSLVLPGSGRILQCLELILINNEESLSENCRTKLQQRIEMFQNAELLAAEEPKGFEDLLNHMSNSPAKNYFAVSLITIVGLIFILGLFCGRATRKYTLLKNK